jgi:hypothetical protein
MIQLPLFATYRVFIVHRLRYMFRLYSHLQVCHVYKNAKNYYNFNGSVNMKIQLITNNSKI